MAEWLMERAGQLEAKDHSHHHDHHHGHTHGLTNRSTQRIKLWGIVQGAGFRPFVAKTAHRMGMKGEVLNIGGLVEIAVTDTSQRIDAFVEAIET